MRQLKLEFEQKIKSPTKDKFTLKTLRFKARLKQSFIADMTRGTADYIPQSTLSDWELGKKVPDADSLLTLCRLYKCSEREILIAWKNTKSYYFVD
jgi:transcriptional regulator with XRE-family HTH domain